MKSTVLPGTLVYTDEYGIYARLEEWGYGDKSVNHGAGEYARDKDGDGFHEVHVNTMEGFWSLLRSWLRPHRGISQEKLPFYLGFFEFVHNVGKRAGKPCFTRWFKCLSNKTLKRNMSQKFNFREVFYVKSNSKQLCFDIF